MVKTRSQTLKEVTRETRTIPDLPLDLESEILSRLDTKTLPKLQLYCKAWYNLFKEPYFVKKNMGKSEREVMMLLNSKLHSVTINHAIHDHSIDASMEFNGKLCSRDKPKRVSVSEIFYREGLVLCTISRENRLVVWNPCNGQTRSIEPRTRYTSDDFYALGHGKILRVCNGEFEMYEFSSDSWRVLDVDTHGRGIKSPGVSLKGSAYWIAEDDPYHQFILGFDFTTETCKRLALPYQNDDPNESMTDDPESMAVLSVVKDEKLSVLHQYLHRLSLKMKIWVTDNIHEIETKEVSWSKFLVVSLGDYAYELRRYVEVVSFLLDEENKVAVCCSLDVGEENKKTRVFVVGEGKHKQVYQGATLPESWPFLLDYVPCLAHIQKNIPTGKRKTKRHEPKKDISKKRKSKRNQDQSISKPSGVDEY